MTEIETAVASVAVRCEFEEMFGRCDKEAVKVLVWEIPLYNSPKPRLAERYFCIPHFDHMVDLCIHHDQDWDSDLL